MKIYFVSDPNDKKLQKLLKKKSSNRLISYEQLKNMKKENIKEALKSNSTDNIIKPE